MSATINLSALTFTADQLRTMNELVVTAVLESPDLSLFHTLHQGIKNDREIGIVPGTLGLMGKAAQGCDPVADTTLGATATMKKWEPKRIEVILDQCATDIAASMAKLARKLGVEVNDLTSTQYFDFLLELLVVDIPKMIHRHVWFGNKAAANVDDSPAGVITSGVDVDYFNVINGFWYQLAVIYAAAAARKTAIAANAEATRALQFSVLAASSGLAAYNALNSIVDDAPATLVGQSDKLIIVTNSVAKSAYRYLQSKGIGYDINLQTNGFGLSSWDGIPLYIVPLWDQFIEAYENNGTKLNSPHRIVFTTKTNLNVGMEGSGLFENVNSFYDKKSRVNRIETSDAFDAKIIDDGLLQVGI
jgi:hypothetical protein